MAETNGQGKTRLDRIEELIERHITKVLLAAQVIFQDNMQQLESKMAETP